MGKSELIINTVNGKIVIEKDTLPGYHSILRQKAIKSHEMILQELEEMQGKKISNYKTTIKIW